MNRRTLIENPFRPGAGHAPPVFSGRAQEITFLKHLLHLPRITENILVTGLRGYGKTVLLSIMKQYAAENDWLVVGNDLSESSALTEDRLALRIMTDLAEAIASKSGTAPPPGMSDPARPSQDPHRPTSTLNFDAMRALYEQAPGLPSDKLRAVLRRVSEFVERSKLAGLFLAFDEAQCLTDNAARDQFPMSMLIETVSHLQTKAGIAPCVLALSGLPPVFDALTQARTYTERMFHVMPLERLSRDEALQAMGQPLKKLTPLRVSPELLSKATDLAAGYPYLIQFFGRELVDGLLANGGVMSPENFPSSETLDRLDSGLFAARWNRTTDKQRDFLGLIASRTSESGLEFSASELSSMALEQEMAAQGNAQQVLSVLCERGLLYRTRRGYYAFTIPYSEAMINRRLQREEGVHMSWANVLTAVPPPPPVTRATSRDSTLEAEERPVLRKKSGWFRRA